MTEYLALCNRIPGNELVAAECENLTGGTPDSFGVAPCHSIEGIRHSAYIHAGLRLIAQGETLAALVQAIACSDFPADDFRIEYLRISEHNPVRWKEAVLAIANVLPARPNLNTPLHRFLLVLAENRLWFGEILIETAHTYQLHDAKPCRTSSSLPAQLARALVNLVAPPAGTILDPCCGTGSILLEAHSLGLQAYGMDKNPTMVELSRKNLLHFGYPVEVSLADARQLSQTADAIVTDLPYGKFSPMDRRDILEILNHAAFLAPVAVFVAGSDISASLSQAGYRNVETFRVRKRDEFSRYVHRARSEMVT